MTSEERETPFAETPGPEPAAGSAEVFDQGRPAEAGSVPPPEAPMDLAAAGSAGEHPEGWSTVDPSPAPSQPSSGPGAAAPEMPQGDAPEAGGPVPPARPPRPALEATEASEDDRLMSALAWVSMVILQIPLLSVVLLLSDNNKRRPFQRYHAIASIIFWIAAMAYEVVAAFAYIVLGTVTLGCLLICLWPIFLLPHLAALWFGLQAYQGRYSEIPLISQLARDQHWT